jgi:hypothetical protein
LCKPGKRPGRTSAPLTQWPAPSLRRPQASLQDSVAYLFLVDG